MECKCETCVRKDCADRTKQDDLRIVINCSDYLNMERQMTNADRIRAMTDEELAWELMTWRIETEAKHQGVESTYPNTQATILEWLQQPAEGDA